MTSRRQPQQRQSGGFLRLGGFAALVLLPSAALGIAWLPTWQDYEADQARHEQEVQALVSAFSELRKSHNQLGEELTEQLQNAQQKANQVAHMEAENLARLEADMLVEESGRNRLQTELQQLRQDFVLREAVFARQAERRDPDQRRHALQRDILSPVFQLAGKDAVGSAVLLESSQGTDRNLWWALTSYHVVRDILGDTRYDENGASQPVEAYFEIEGEELVTEARMVAHDEDNDLALLRIEEERDLGGGAKIAPMARMNRIESFQPIYTVGCPLGTAAQATRGEITRTAWESGGQPLWMISSPAFFGNSGGGVFLEESRELIGIFAKIYTHGSFRPQVITHMGLAVPLDVIHNWLAEESYGFLLPSQASVAKASSRKEGE